jgi:ankyrin repeat protein
MIPFLLLFGASETLGGGLPAGHRLGAPHPVPCEHQTLGRGAGNFAKRTGRAEVVDRSGRTDLHIAAACGEEKRVERLLLQGSNPRSRDLNGQEPLHAAAFSGSERCVRLLVAYGADPNAVDHTGRTALWFGLGDPSTRSLLLCLGARADSNSLPVNTKGGFIVWPGGTLAHFLFGGSPVPRAKVPDVLRQLAKYGLDVNVPNDNGTYPLHSAASLGPKFVKVLLQLGARANVKDRAGRIPWDYVRGSGLSREDVQALVPLLGEMPSGQPIDTTFYGP